ncbi:sensor histidine kinase [Acidovorax sp. M2(2025)]|uniref:sensor histidine kinase n=1 Tax=Acidovorax sp. M2(2025) TaxID=3411355 RepID=UPI003BF55DDE
MFRTRPPWFAAVCIGTWLLQFALMTAVALWRETTSGPQHRWLELAALGTTLVLGVMLLVQLPRALQWRPRLSVRPSAEVLAQRRRIARDLHDNVGSQLVFALALLESSEDRDQVRAALEKCLLDLRLLTDAMGGDDASLADRLAQLRYRIGPVLAQRGIRMFWNVEVAPEADFPHRDSAAQLVAIVQEALSNALQHAQATEIELRASTLPDPACWCLEIRDNGQGLASPHGGSGMAGMAHRAILAGGALHVLPGAQGGTSIRVVIPLTGRMD